MRANRAAGAGDSQRFRVLTDAMVTDAVLRQAIDELLTIKRAAHEPQSHRGHILTSHPSSYRSDKGISLNNQLPIHFINAN